MRRSGTAREQVAADPQLSHYAAPWPRPDDLGVVVEDENGEGLGAELCRRLLDAADHRGTPQVSLSVEKANPALVLYQRLGFETARDDGDALTLRRLCARGLAPRR